MDKIKKIETELPLILKRSEEHRKDYRRLQKEYDEKSCELKNLYMIYRENRIKDEKKNFKKEQENIKKIKHTYQNIIKVFQNKKKMSKNIFVIDRCGIEILKDRDLTNKKLKNYAKINKIKRYTKMNTSELITSLLKI